jgi:2-hydroxy-3-oxopropionate reductase
LEDIEMKVGFIGLGIMGRPMVGRLLDGGHELCLNDHKPVPATFLTRGARAGATARDVAKNSDIIITMVPDTPDVNEVLFGADSVSEGLSPGKTVVDMSSISPIETRSFAGRINDLGCEYLDAPVSGGEVGAKQGTLTIMVGGPQSAFDRVRPLFELMGKNITLVGRNGDGQTTKVANQIIVALNIEAVGEALLFAAKAGADPATVRKALMGGFASSRVLETHGERMINRSFEPGFRVKLHQKDLNLALAAARSLKMSLPNTATCQELFNACAAHGGDGWDHSAMVRALEWLADHQVGPLAEKA